VHSGYLHLASNRAPILITFLKPTDESALSLKPTRRSVPGAQALTPGTDTAADADARTGRRRPSTDGEEVANLHPTRVERVGVYVADSAVIYAWLWGPRGDIDGTVFDEDESAYTVDRSEYAVNASYEHARGERM